MGFFHQATVVCSAGTSGAQAWMPLDMRSVPFAVSFFARKIGTGDITYRVEHTADNVLAPTSGAEVSARTVFTHTDVSAATASRDGNYAFPVRAIRMFTGVASGQGSIEFTVIQGDGP